MALYLKLHVMRSIIYVESFMALWKVHNIANFGDYAAILYSLVKVLGYHLHISYSFRCHV